MASGAEERHTIPSFILHRVEKLGPDSRALIGLLNWPIRHLTAIAKISQNTGEADELAQGMCTNHEIGMMKHMC